MNDLNPNVLVIVGPTAIGKTALGIELSEYSDVEIVSADSRQLYRYMDICTAKPDNTQRLRVPHHFIDHINPDETYNAAQYAREALPVIQSIFDRGKLPVIVGGSGLYIRALIDGFFEGVDNNETVRDEIRKQIDSEGIVSVFEELRQNDPETANRLHIGDIQRIERALEVFRVTGKPLSQWHKETQSKFPWNSLWVGLDCDRTKLYQRIEMRVDQMIEQGVIGETEMLLELGYSENLISMQSLGYREIIAYLKGTMDRDTMLRLFKQGSRNYAKRQLTWFRKNERIRWIMTDKNSPEKILDDTLKHFNLNK